MTGLDGETVDVGPVTVGQPLPRTDAAAEGPSAVEIVTEAVRTLRYKGLTPTRRRPHFEDIVVAEVVLEALHAAGWRIVRTEPAGLWEDPRFEGPYNEDERRPSDAYELFAIADEWEPAKLLMPGDPDPEAKVP